MISVSLILSAVVLIGASIALSMLFLRLVRHYLKIHTSPREEAIAGYLFNAVVVVYAVILAFVVFAVWDRYATVQGTVTNEAAALVVAFRDTQDLPEPARGNAQKAYRAYAHFVMAREWASHGAVMRHTTPDPLNYVWDIYRQDAYEGESSFSSAKASLNALETQRHLRHLAGEASLPSVFWPLLIGGGLVMISFSYFFVMRSFISQGVLTAFLTAVIVGALFLIYSLNYPFTGYVQVSRDPFRHALEQFNALNLPTR